MPLPKEKQAAKALAFYRENKERINARRRELRHARPKEPREYTPATERELLYQAQYREANREMIRARDRAYRAAHKDDIQRKDRERGRLRRERKSETQRLWRARNGERLKAYRQNMTTHARLATRLRIRMCNAIRRVMAGSPGTGSAVRDLGCSIVALMAHLESMFSDGMSWDLWGHGKGKWHIDHVRPLASFDLLVREQFLTACHFTNLQPLWSVDNLRKGAR